MSVDVSVAVAVSATLAFVVSQTWKCLCAPATGKNGIFKKVFFDEDILLEVATAANLTFCHGLLDVVRSPTPPDISFFKNTPSRSLGLWGVYCLVLEKPGEVPLVYVGSASNKDKGIPGRWKYYNSPHTPSYRKLLPSKVREALDNGYKIVHKGVLAWSSIPQAKNVPRSRLLFYSMEAMFSFLFWAMFPKTGDYQIGSCCPWPRESFTYRGLCSHSSLNDLMRADVKLSAEDLEKLAADAVELQKQKNRDRYINNKEKMIATTLKSKRKRMADPVRHEEFKAKERKDYPNAREAILASKKYFCDTCQVACGKPGEFEKHKETARHKKREQWALEGKVLEHWCDDCGIGFDKAKTLRSHQKSGPHFRKVNGLARTPNADVVMTEGTPVVEEGNPFAVEEDTPFVDGTPSAAQEDPSFAAEDDDITEEDPQDLFCGICDRLCVNEAEFQWHNQSDNHKRRVAKVEAGVEFNHRCHVCNKGFETAWTLKNHEMSQKHKDKVAELQEDDDYYGY